jgi:hypothetical protein
MIKEIYIRNPEDPNYKINVLDHSDPIESIISKIKVIFGTRQGEVIGDLNFGIGLEDLVFETRINKLQLEEDIKRQIGQYVSESSDYKIEPKVSFGKAVGYDYCVIDIYIDNVKTFGILVK